MQILAALGSIAAFIGRTLAAGAGAVISFVTSKAFLKIAALSAAAVVFAGLWVANFNIVKDLIQDAFGSAAGAVSGDGIASSALQLCFCMAPSQMPEALSVMLNIMVTAVITKMSRQVLMAKANI